MMRQNVSIVMSYIQHHQRLGLSVKVLAKSGVTSLVLSLLLLTKILCVKFVRNFDYILLIPYVAESF